VQHRAGEDRIESLGCFERACVAGLKPQPGETATCLRDHLRRRVNFNNVGARRRSFGGELARAAPEVEDPFAGLDVEQFEQAPAELPDEGATRLRFQE